MLDSIGSSETGMQASNPSNKQTGVSTGDFRPLAGAGVVSADLTRVLAPGDDEMGWFAQKGRVPLGYFGDAEKTAKTFPVIDGVRWSVPGDRARYRADGSIEVLGRDSVTINSGGEKIFAEEVEQALKHHPAVFDAVVAGRPSERWGQEVVAVVQLRARLERHARGPARRGRQAPRPLQAPEAVRVPRRDPAQPERQGGLSLGEGAGGEGLSGGSGRVGPGARLRLMARTACSAPTERSDRNEVHATRSSCALLRLRRAPGPPRC